MAEVSDPESTPSDQDAKNAAKLRGMWSKLKPGWDIPEQPPEQPQVGGKLSERIARAQANRSRGKFGK